MGLCRPFIVVVCSVLVLLSATAASAMDRCGPAQSPFKWLDFGGTPDALISTDLGLDVEEIERLLAGLGARSVNERRGAAEEIMRNASGSEQALREVLWRDHKARNIEMRNAVQAARRRIERSASGSPATLLDALLDMDQETGDQGDGVRGAVRIMTMLEALRALNTMAGYKILLEFSGRHAGVFRQDIGRMFVDSGVDALPALIYGRKSSDKETHMFAVKWIRDMGNLLLGEQIRSLNNPRRLAQLLEAYASVNDLGAIEVTLALTNHESAFVRCAARACLERFGVNAKWALRRQYENTFSREPRAGTDFDSWREDLYSHYDSVRIAPAMELFERGLRFAGEGDTARMSECFEGVLREFPMFPRRNEMADGFLLHARKMEDKGDTEASKRATMMALRVSPRGSRSARLAEARLDLMRTESMRALGVLDLESYRRIGEFAPDPKLASKRLTEGEGGAAKRQRTIQAIAVSMSLFVGGLLVLLRLRLIVRRHRAPGGKDGS